MKLYVALDVPTMIGPHGTLPYYGAELGIGVKGAENAGTHSNPTAHELLD